MKKTVFLSTIAASALFAGVAMAADGDTLAAVKARGELICGANTGLTGFGAPDANGNYQGFDVALCKAVAAAVLGDPTKVKFCRPLVRRALPRWPRAKLTFWSATRPGHTHATPRSLSISSQ